MAAIFQVERGCNLRFRLALSSMCLMAAGCLSGCDYLPFGYTKIGDIVANAAQFEGREVKIRGKVTDSSKIPLLDIKSYSLQDNTGTILVITQDSLPPMGQEIAIRGTAQSVLIVSGQSFGLTLKETARLPAL
jgi:hypothetical protein